MASGNTTTDKNPFLSNLISSMANKLPYSAVDQRPESENPYYKTFYELGTQREEKVRNRAVSTLKTDTNADLSDVMSQNGYFNFVYNNINTDKNQRISEYRAMALYAAVANALDKVCDEFVVPDEKNHICKLIFDTEIDINPVIKNEILKEFRFLENNFKLRKKAWEYIRTILVEGEKYFENIISKDKPDLGIIGIVEIPNSLIDPIYDNVQNMQIKGYVLRKYNFDPKTKQQSMVLLPMEKNQVTYMHSGIFNGDMSFRLPFIENARRAFRQLTMIEDAIVIYRMVMAPEKLKISVELGNNDKPRSEQYMKGLMQKFWSRKTFDPSTQSTGTGTTNIYNPQSMLDAYWIPMRNGTPEMTIDKLQGGTGLGKLEDLEFFQKALYESLKIPSNRLNPDNAFSDGGEINRQELEFAKFIIRLQSNFAEVIKNTFITHLKLRGMWEEYDLYENDFDVVMNPPLHYNELSNQHIKEIRYNNFNTLASNPMFSPTYLMLTELKMTDKEVLANRKGVVLDAALLWEVEQIKASGPDFRKQAAQAGQGGAGGPPMGGGAPMGGPPMASGGGGDINNPPEFGEGEIPTDATATAPSNNVEPAPDINS